MTSQHPLPYSMHQRNRIYLLGMVVICLKIRTFVVSATTVGIEWHTKRLLWFAWKFVPLWYQQQLWIPAISQRISCDLLENSYLCGISNNRRYILSLVLLVVICLKIRTFVVSATTRPLDNSRHVALWFAWKFVPLWYQQQHLHRFVVCYCRCDLLENSYLCGISNNIDNKTTMDDLVVICLKIRTFVVSATTLSNSFDDSLQLWFAWKFVPLWYQQQLNFDLDAESLCCDLLENSYLCGISNNFLSISFWNLCVVICLKIRTFVVSATTDPYIGANTDELWFAWKFVPLWYQQQLSNSQRFWLMCCDLLENSYLCGISNNKRVKSQQRFTVVICLKIRTFVVSATTHVIR